MGGGKCVRTGGIPHKEPTTPPGYQRDSILAFAINLLSSNCFLFKLSYFVKTVFILLVRFLYYCSVFSFSLKSYFCLYAITFRINCHYFQTVILTSCMNTSIPLFYVIHHLLPYLPPKIQFYFSLPFSCHTSSTVTFIHLNNSL